MASAFLGFGERKLRPWWKECEFSTQPLSYLLPGRCSENYEERQSYSFHCLCLFIFLKLFDCPGISFSISSWLQGLFLKIGSVFQNAISPALLNFLQKNTGSLSNYTPIFTEAFTTHSLETFT